MRYGELFKEGVGELEASGIQEAQTDCFILFLEAFSLTRASYFLKEQEEIPRGKEDQVELFFSWLHRRKNHEPVQYIIGNQEFCGLKFFVNRHVLIPRLDTEVLVEEILKQDSQNKSLLDLCTGSGCILISLMRLGKFSRGVGTDISQDALNVAKENAKLNNVSVKFLEGDLFEALKALQGDEKKFDVIVANPPYIAKREKGELSPEVLCEPSLALFADRDGLEFYEKILKSAGEYLKVRGRIYFEIGCAQGEAVKELCRQNGFFEVEIVKDLAGLDRVVSARLKG